MVDVHDKETRSFNMSRIKAKNTRPEMIVRKFLFSKGFRYKLHDKKLPGKPDLVLPKYRAVVLIHGCFWHGHKNCKYAVTPKTRRDWWAQKISETKKRDLIAHMELMERDFNVLTIYECQLRPGFRKVTLKNLIEQLLSE